MRSGSVPWSVIALALVLAGCTSVGSAAGPPSSITKVELAAIRPPDPTVPASTVPAAVIVTSPVDESTVGASPVDAPASPSTTNAPLSPVRLMFTGDVLMHSPLWRQAVRNSGGGAPDFVPMFEAIAPLVRQADLAVCHMETPIAPPGEAWSTDPRYGVPAEVVDALAATGFDHCSTASNHTFDRGIPGVQATIDRFALAGMTQHGMAAVPADNEPVLIDVGGVIIGHLAATYGFDVGVRPPDEPWRTSLIDVERLITDARLARARGAELVVVSLHWGSAGSHRASEYQRTIAQQLADSGVIDLVVGHHAHVVQPIERIGNMWVAYGLGNLISNMPTGDPVWNDATRDGIVLEVDVSRDQASPVIAAVVAHPVWVDHDAGWVVRDVAAARLDPVLVARIGPALDASWARTQAVVGAQLLQSEA